MRVHEERIRKDQEAAKATRPAPAKRKPRKPTKPVMLLNSKIYFPFAFSPSSTRRRMVLVIPLTSFLVLSVLLCFLGQFEVMRLDDRSSAATGYELPDIAMVDDDSDDDLDDEGEVA